MLAVNRQRLLANLQELGAIGWSEDGGILRTALSAADAAGRAWFRDKVRAAGLALLEDGAGNLSAVYPTADPQAKTILFGSHLDTVPNGGRFDGALGVLAALEVLQTLQEAAIQRPYNLEAISFTDEEGSHISFLGSRALTGDLSAQDLAQPRQGPAAFKAGLERLQLTTQGILEARRDPQTLAAFVECHVEQGGRLEREGLDIGVVTAAVGIRPYWLHFRGVAAHAGTMPMRDRADALWGASAFVQRARTLVQEQFAPGVMNVGQLYVAPGAFNIVPDSVRLSLEFRHGSEEKLDEMAEALLAVARQVAAEFRLTVSIEPGSDCQAAPMDEGVIRAIEEAAGDLGLRFRRLISFAGHDAQILSRVTPTAMFFVPSVDGISHHAAEFTDDNDVVNGANTLLHTILKLQL